MGSDQRLRWRVVVNDEGQYAVQPSSLEVPRGWRDGGFAGSEADCVGYVDQTWADLRPESVRGAVTGG